MTLKELIESIHDLDLHMKKFEEKYGLCSDDFYALFKQGKIEEGGVEQTGDVNEWAGVYEIKQKRMERFHQVSQQFIGQRARNGTVSLEPASCNVEVG